MWYVRDVPYAVLYVCVSSFVVRGCGVSRMYIDVCYCDVFSVVCINSQRYVCCSECNVVSNEHTSCLMLTCSMMRVLSLLLLGLCVCVVLVALCLFARLL